MIYKINCGNYDLAIDKIAYEIINSCKNFTMTGQERLLSVIESVRYIIKNNIQGDLIECGVWKGGSSMAVALTLSSLNIFDKTIYLYDTFEGMTKPTDIDKDKNGKSPSEILSEENYKTSNYWAISPFNEVFQNMKQTNYPLDKIIFVKGDVENTIPNTIPKSISFLRLDTDWYESTLHELTHLYPLVSKDGITIIDDYGYWQGSKIATDKYFENNELSPFLHRVDHTARLIIKK